jgi:hypothetical protein
MQTTKFKVGDVVYDSVNYPKQKGKITYIDYDDTYPIYIEFNGGYNNSYTLDGKYIENDSCSVLSFTPYEVEFKGFTQERPKVLTDEMKVCIKGDGTAEYGKKITAHLEGLGCNTLLVSGTSLDYYSMNRDFVINVSNIIPQGYKEISLKEDAIKQVCYVGKKIEYCHSTCLIVQQNRETIDFMFDGKQEVIMIDDITNGKYRIID